MPTRAPTPCPRCHTLDPCPHRGDTQRHRSNRQTIDHNATLVADWIQQHGHWCPGWQRPGHEAHDLTADHTESVRDIGPHPADAVLCRTCNSSKGAS